MKPFDFVEAARVPTYLKAQTFGLWTIAKFDVASMPLTNDEQSFVAERLQVDRWTPLSRATEATMMFQFGEVVMDDGNVELRKHLPIWLRARGRVLVTGLGLGCVVRGLLANRDVDLVDVVEIDKNIARVVGHEFAGNSRVRLHVGDALTFPAPDRPTWDFAWHDLWCEGGGLQTLHARLIIRFRRSCREQGAWAFPREFGRRMIDKLINAPGYRRGRRQKSSSRARP